MLVDSGSSANGHPLAGSSYGLSMCVHPFGSLFFQFPPLTRTPVKPDFGLIVSFSLSHLVKDFSLQILSYILTCRGLELQHMNLGEGDNSAQNMYPLPIKNLSKVLFTFHG